MSDFLTTTIAVIDELGGNSAVAEMSLTTTKAVWNWRSSNVFPANTYVALTSALKVKGKCAPDSLWAMRNVTPAEQVAS